MNLALNLSSKNLPFGTRFATQKLTEKQHKNGKYEHEMGSAYKTT